MGAKRKPREPPRVLRIGSMGRPYAFLTLYFLLWLVSGAVASMLPMASSFLILFRIWLTLSPFVVSSSLTDISPWLSSRDWTTTSPPTTWPLLSESLEGRCKITLKWSIAGQNVGGLSPRESESLTMKGMPEPLPSTGEPEPLGIGVSAISRNRIALQQQPVVS